MVLVAVVIALSVWAAYLSDSVAAQYDELYNMYVNSLRQTQMYRLAEGVAQYTGEKGSYPASLAVLSSTAGYEHVKALLNNWQGYGVSAAITDGVWTFKRAVTFTNDPTTGTTPSAYLATNACGTGGYDTATSWCGSKTSMWFRHETREGFNDQIMTERARMNRLSQKFANYYNANARYPTVDGSNVALAADSITALADLVGYAGTASACSGQYQYQGIPIDCSDMFNSWGTKVGYQFVSAAHIILVSETPILNSSGVPILVAVDRA